MTWNAHDLKSDQIAIVAFQNLAIAGLGFLALRSGSLLATVFALGYILANSYGYMLYSMEAILTGNHIVFTTTNPTFHWWAYGPNIENVSGLVITYFTVFIMFGALFQLAKSRKENGA